MFIRLNKQKNELPKYHRVSYEEAKKNPQYWKIVENMFNEQAARLIQRGWRKKHGKTYKGKYSETLNGPLSMRFIKELTDPTKPMEYAKKINTGMQADLDFKDPEFVRNLYKALRLGYINQNQMVDALLLHGMKEFFKSDIRRQHYSQKDAFGTSINFATEENKKSFTERLKQIPESDRCYFTTNLSNHYTAAFLYHALTYTNLGFEGQFSFLFPKFTSFFKCYLNSKPIPYAERSQILSKLAELSNPNKYITASAALQNFILNHEDEENRDFILVRMNNKDRTNISFLVGLLRVEEEMPALEISPDYDANNPNSPLLCFNLPTTAVLSQMEYALVGEKETIEPYFSVGQISTRMMRFLDEKPDNYEVKKPSRPVELTHPDIAKQKSYHTVDAVNFLITWHDLFHTWKSSLNLYKDFSRYLNQLEEKITGFEMSKGIWSLVDRDSIYGSQIRKYKLENNHEKQFLKQYQAVGGIINEIGDDLFNHTSANDLNLIFIIDMIINRSKWDALTGTDPSKFSYYSFQQCYKNLDNIIKSEPNHSLLFYILAFRLQDHPNGFALCKDLEKIGIENILYWKKDLGLYFKLAGEKEANERIKVMKSDVAIKDMSIQDLYFALRSIKTNAIEKQDSISMTDSKKTPSSKWNNSIFSLMGMKKNTYHEYDSNDLNEAIIQTHLKAAITSGLTTTEEVSQLKNKRQIINAIFLNEDALIAFQQNAFTLRQLDLLSAYDLKKILAQKERMTFDYGFTFAMKNRKYEILDVLPDDILKKIKLDRKSIEEYLKSLELCPSLDQIFLSLKSLCKMEMEANDFILILNTLRDNPSFGHLFQTSDYLKYKLNKCIKPLVINQTELNNFIVSTFKSNHLKGLALVPEEFKTNLPLTSADFKKYVETIQNDASAEYKYIAIITLLKFQLTPDQIQTILNTFSTLSSKPLWFYSLVMHDTEGLKLLIANGLNLKTTANGNSIFKISVVVNDIKAIEILLNSDINLKNEKIKCLLSLKTLIDHKRDDLVDLYLRKCTVELDIIDQGIEFVKAKKNPEYHSIEKILLKAASAIESEQENRNFYSRL